MLLENNDNLLDELELAGFPRELAQAATTLALDACEAARIELLLSIDQCEDQKTRILAKCLSTTLMQSWCEDKSKLIPLAIASFTETEND